MSELNTKAIKHVSRLAKLPLKSKEVEKFKGQLSSIFDYVDKVGEMKTEGIKETSQVAGIKNIFRKDKIRLETMLTQDQALSNSKKSYKGYFLVKAIFSE